MTSFRTHRFSPYSAEFLFSLAGRVEDYPHFVMFCSNARMIGERVADGDQTCFDAALEIGYPALGIETEFTSHVTLDRAGLSVTAVGVPQNVIRSLDSHWHFTRQDNGSSRIDFFVACSLRSQILQFALDGVFSSVAEKIADSFVRRAQEVYALKT